MELKKLVIDRPHWGKHRLMNSDGTMCCLGFAAKACGYTDEQIRGFSYLYKEIHSNVPDWMNIGTNEKEPNPRAGLNAQYTVPAYDAAAFFNDSNLPQSEKEEKLIALFAKRGTELVFVDELPSDPVPETQV